MDTKWQIGAALCATFALVALRGEAHEVRGQDDLGPRVVALEQEVIELAAANAELLQVLGTTRALVDETVAYLAAQSEAATAMQATLSESETLGFTAGINYESREVLLAGWRESLKTAQKNLPGVKVEEEVPARPGAAGRQAER